jgi:hypothetical protein
MPALENEQQEAFAQARFAGKTLAELYLERPRIPYVPHHLHIPYFSI